jgi:hypothetical protein
VLEDISARGWMGETFVIDGVAHFTIGTNGGSKVLESTSALVSYQDGQLKELIGFADWLQVVQRIR